MKKFMNNVSSDILEKDLSGIVYDRPVHGGGFLTHHARKRCKERNVNKKDSILNKPCANNIERDGVIVTVLGVLNNDTKPDISTVRCFHCKKLGHIRKNCPILKQEKINQKNKGKKNKNKKNKDEKINCEMCDKLIFSKNYNYHKCEVGFTCECGKTFKSKNDLLNHKRDKTNCTSKSIKKINLHEKPNEKCFHDWICLNDRVHNRNDGRGKYRAYKCTKCNEFQRRYL